MTLFKSHRPKAAAPLRGKARTEPSPQASGPATPPPAAAGKPAAAGPKELGGPEGPEPTRYGDWERKGICYDF